MASKKRLTKYLALTVIVALPFSSYTANAASLQEVKQIKNQIEKEQSKFPYTRPQLIQNITPSLGSTVVRPDQNIVVQLDKKAPEYNWVSKYIAQGYVNGYVLDEKTNAPIDKNQINFDAVTGQVTVQHPLLNRNTQYAIVLNIGEKDDQNNQYGHNDEEKKYMDVVTAVDTVAKTATLLGHGTISLTSNEEQQYGKSQSDKGQEASGKSHEDKQQTFPYKVGDVVSIHLDKQTGKVNIDERKQVAVSTIFKTGSDLHEATHFVANVDVKKVRATDGGKINVTVTDDYGLPATNAEVTITSNSSNLSAPVLTLGVNDNGNGVIPLTDHKKESVGLTITAQDKTYNEPVNTQKIDANIEIIAGLPDHMNIKADQNLVVGKSEHVTGTVFDKYGNPVENDTIVNATPSGGTITPQEQNSVDGNFDFNFVAPTKLEDVTITAKAGDITSGNAAIIKLKADQPANVKLTTDEKVVKADGKSQSNVSIQVTDQYSNPVAGENVSLTSTGKAGIPSTVTTDVNGNATFSVSDTTSGLNEITASTANGIKSPIVSVITATPLTAQSKVSLKATKQPDGNVIISGSVLDVDGKPTPYSYVPLESTGGALTDSVLATDASGSFTTILTPTSPSTLAKVSVPTASNQPEIGIDPLIYGNQPWTDTGIDVVAGQTVHVVSNGTWADKLYAQINGVPVLIGADGTIVTGSSGRLFLGTNIATYAGNVDSIIYMYGNAQYPDVLPTLDLVVDKASLTADGKSVSIVSGHVMEGNTAVVGAIVNLSLSSANGMIANQVTTDANGNFSTPYTAGTKAETITITGTYSNLVQKSNIVLSQQVVYVQAPVGMLGYTPPKGTTVTASYSYGGTNPNALIDGNLGSVWNSGSYSGTIKLTFPTPQTISAIQVAVAASPATTQGYTIKGLENGVWKTIGTPTPYVNNSAMVILSPMQIKPGTYDAIEVSINGGSSWVQVNEITLLESFSIANSIWSGNLSKSYMAWANWSTPDNIGMVAGNGVANAVSEVDVQPLSENSSIRLSWGSQTNSALTLYASTDGVNYVKVADAPNIGTGDARTETLSLPVNFAGKNKVYLKFSEVWNGTTMSWSYSVATNFILLDGNKVYQIKPSW